MNVRSVKNGDLVMRSAQGVWDLLGNELMMKAHLSCYETRNELREYESGAQIGAFSLTDFYSWPTSEAIRQLAYP